ncbi:putative ubiquitin-protein ligase-like [Leishmania mexicana MHOM/GT/2001/U1103]|uniref:HECT-type E3 ubiquitin transferase n=1 Tax=Leishmania mexicana (strain MHOM/GT/2001/U1103) TaxID=929439 RepID=E9AL38_LEIMU|nr:putative ubiquitin-protein ligase-like [Leishmania mexicana MHOM/GT/2001/U1103]CBZ23641.1 putative ubiquitin-protein ligase-like [Leishmania mexicana MHOM/GT/2001/U1103]
MDPQLLVHLFDTFGADGQNGQLPWGISASDSIALEAQGDGIRFESNGREWRVLQVGTAEDEMSLPPYRGDTQLRDAARVLPPVCFAPLVSKYTRLLRDPRWEVRHVPRMMEAMLNDRVLFHLMDTSPLSPLSDSRVSAMTRWWGVMGKPVLRYENSTGRPLMSLIDGYGSPPSASSDAAEGRQGAGKEARRHPAAGSLDEHRSSAREGQSGDATDCAAAATATSSRMSLEEVRQGYRDIKTVLTLIAATSAPYRCSRPPNASVSGCTARLVFCKDPSTIYLGLLLNSALRGLPRKVLCSMSVFRLIAEGWGSSPSFADILRASWEEYSDILRDIRALLGLPDPTTETPSPPSPAASPSSFSCMSASTGASAAAPSRQQPQYHQRGRRRQLPPMHLPSQQSDSGELGRHPQLQHLGQSTSGASSSGASAGPSTGVPSSAAMVPHTSLRQTRTTAGGRMQAVELGIPIQNTDGGGGARGVNEEARQSTGNNTGDVNDFVTALLGNALHSLNGLQLRRNTANGVGAARGMTGAAGASSGSGEADAPLGSNAGVNDGEHSSAPFKTEDANAICHESMLECAQIPELLLWWARCRLLAYQLLDNPSRVSVESTGALEYFREVWACTPLIREILEDDQEALLVTPFSSPRLSVDEQASEEMEAERASKKARLEALQGRARRMYAALVGAVADLSKFWFSIRVAQSIVNAVASSAPETNTVWSIINATVPSRRRFQREEFSTYAEYWQYALLVDDYVTQPMCFRVSTRGRTMVTQLLHILSEYPTFYPALVARTLAMLNRREMIVAELNERLVNAVARCLRFYLPPMPPALAVPPVQAASTSVSAGNATVAGTAETPVAPRVSSAAVADVTNTSTDGTAAATPVTVARAPRPGAGASQRSWSSPEDSSSHSSSFSSEHAEEEADGDVGSGGGGGGAAAQATAAPSTSGGDGDASTRGGIDYEALVVMRATDGPDGDGDGDCGRDMHNGKDSTDASSRRRMREEMAKMPVITVKAYDAILTCLDVLRMLVRNGHISVNPMNLLFTVPSATSASAVASASPPASVDQQAGGHARTGGAVGSDTAAYSPADTSAANTSAGPLYEASLPKSQCDLYTLLHQLVYQTRYGPLASAALRLFSACVHYNVRDMVPLFAERGLLNTALAIARRPRLFSEDVATAAAPLRFALDTVEENGMPNIARRELPPAHSTSPSSSSSGPSPLVIAHPPPELVVRYVPAEDAYLNAVAVRMVLPEFVEAMTVHKATHRVFSKHTEWITALTQSLTVTPAMSAASLLDIEALLDESAEVCSEHEADDIDRSEDVAIGEDEGGCQVPCDAPPSPSESPASAAHYVDPVQQQQQGDYHSAQQDRQRWLLCCRSSAAYARLLQDLTAARRRPLGAFPVPAARSSTSSADSVVSHARHNERRPPPQCIGGASHSADTSAPIDVVLTRMVELHRLHLKREEVSYKTLQGAVKEVQRVLTEVLQPSPLITSRFAPALRAELSLLSQRTHEFAQAVRAGATHPHPFLGSTADSDEVTVAGQSVVAGSTSGSGVGPRTRADYLHLLVQGIEVCRTLNNFFAFFSALDWDGHQRRYRLSRRSAEQQASQQELAMVLESTVRDFHMAVNQLWSLMGSHAPLQLCDTDAAEDKEMPAAQDERGATNRRGHSLRTRARLGNPLQVYEQGNADGASSLLSYVQATIGPYLHARIFGDYLRSAPPSTRMEATLKSTVQCILHVSSRDFIGAPEVVMARDSGTDGSGGGEALADADGAMSKTMRRRCLKAMKRVLEGQGSEAQRHSSNDLMQQPRSGAGETAEEGRGDDADVRDGAQHSPDEAAAVERVYYHTSESPCKDVISSVLRPLGVGDGVFLRQLLEAWRVSTSGSSGSGGGSNGPGRRDSEATPWRSVFSEVMEFAVDALVVRAPYTADDVAGLLRSLQAGTQHSSVSAGILSLYDRNAEAGATVAPVTPAALPAAVRGRSGSEEEIAVVAGMDASDQILQSMLQDGRSLLNEPSTAWMTAEAWVQATTSAGGAAAAAAGDEPSLGLSSAAEVPQQADARPVAPAEAAAAGGDASAEALSHSAFSIVVPSVLAGPHARGGGRHGGRRRSHGGISRGADSEDSVDSGTTLSSSLPTLTPPTALATDAVGDAAAAEGLAGSADGVGSGVGGGGTAAASAAAAEQAGAAPLTTPLFAPINAAKALQQWLFLSLFTGRRAADQPTRNFFYLSPYRRDGHARPALPLNVTGLLRTIRNDLQAAFEDAVRGASAGAGSLGPTPGDGAEDEPTRQLHVPQTQAKQRNAHDSDDEEASIVADLQGRLHMFRPQPRHENRAGAAAGNGGGGHAAFSSGHVHTACEWFDLDPRELAVVNLPSRVNVEACLNEVNFVAARRVLWELAVLGAVCTGGSGAAPEFESTPLHDMLSRAAQFMILLSRLVFSGDAEAAKRASAAAGGGSFTSATTAAPALLSPAAAALKDKLQRCLVYMAVLLMNFLEGCDARTRGRHCTHVESLLYCVLDVWPKLPGFPMVPHVYVAAMEAVAQLKPETLSRMSFQSLAREWQDGAAKPAPATTTAAATVSTVTSPRLPSPQPREREGTAAGDDDDEEEEGGDSDVQRSSAEEARTTITGDGSRRFNQSPWARAGLLHNGRAGAPSPGSSPMQERFGQYVTRLQQSRRSQLGAPLSAANEWGRALPWVCDVAAGRIFPLDTLSETGHRLLRKRACRALWGIWTGTNVAEQQYVLAYMLHRVLSNVRENVVLLEYVGVLLTQLRGVVLVEALALTPLPRAIVKVVRQAIEEVTAEQHEEEARLQTLSGASAGAAAAAQREFRQRRRRSYARTQMTLHGQLVSFLSVFQNVRSDAPLVADPLSRTAAMAPHVQGMGAQCSYFDATRNTFCWNGHQCHRQHVVPVNGQRGRDGEEHRFGLNTFGSGTQHALDEVLSVLEHHGFPCPLAMPATATAARSASSAAEAASEENAGEVAEAEGHAAVRPHASSAASDPTQSTGRQPQAHQPSQRVVRLPLSAGTADPNTVRSRPQNPYEVERRTWQGDRARRERLSTIGDAPGAAHGNRGDEGSIGNRDGTSADVGERALPSQAGLVTADATGPENYQRVLRGEGLPWLPLSARPAPSSSSLQQLRGGLSGPRDLDYGGDDMDEETQGVFTHLTGAFGGSRRERSPLRHRLLNPLTSADFRADPLRRSIIPHCAMFGRDVCEEVVRMAFDFMAARLRDEAADKADAEAAKREQQQQPGSTGCVSFSALPGNIRSLDGLLSTSPQFPSSPVASPVSAAALPFSGVLPASAAASVTTAKAVAARLTLPRVEVVECAVDEVMVHFLLTCFSTYYTTCMHLVRTHRPAGLPAPPAATYTAAARSTAPASSRDASADVTSGCVDSLSVLCAYITHIDPPNREKAMLLSGLLLTDMMRLEEDVWQHMVTVLRTTVQVHRKGRRLTDKAYAALSAHHLRLTRVSANTPVEPSSPSREEGRVTAATARKSFSHRRPRSQAHVSVPSANSARHQAPSSQLAESTEQEELHADGGATGAANNDDAEAAITVHRYLIPISIFLANLEPYIIRHPIAFYHAFRRYCEVRWVRAAAGEMPAAWLGVWVRPRPPAAGATAAGGRGHSPRAVRRPRCGMASTPSRDFVERVQCFVQHLARNVDAGQGRATQGASMLAVVVQLPGVCEALLSPSFEVPVPAMYAELLTSTAGARGTPVSSAEALAATTAVSGEEEVGPATSMANVDRCAPAVSRWPPVIAVPPFLTLALYFCSALGEAGRSSGASGVGPHITGSVDFATAIFAHDPIAVSEVVVRTLGCLVTGVEVAEASSQAVSGSGNDSAVGSDRDANEEAVAASTRDGLAAAAQQQQVEAEERVRCTRKTLIRCLHDVLCFLERGSPQPATAALPARQRATQQRMGVSSAVQESFLRFFDHLGRLGLLDLLFRVCLLQSCEHGRDATSLLQLLAHQLLALGEFKLAEMLSPSQKRYAAHLQDMQQQQQQHRLPRGLSRTSLWMGQGDVPASLRRPYPGLHGPELANTLDWPPSQLRDSAAPPGLRHAFDHLEALLARDTIRSSGDGAVQVGDNVLEITSSFAGEHGVGAEAADANALHAFLTFEEEQEEGDVEGNGNESGDDDGDDGANSGSGFGERAGHDGAAPRPAAPNGVEGTDTWPLMHPVRRTGGMRSVPNDDGGNEEELNVSAQGSVQQRRSPPQLLSSPPALVGAAVPQQTSLVPGHDDAVRGGRSDEEDNRHRRSVALAAYEEAVIRSLRAEEAMRRHRRRRHDDDDDGGAEEAVEDDDDAEEDYLSPDEEGDEEDDSALFADDMVDDGADMDGDGDVENLFRSQPEMPGFFVPSPLSSARAAAGGGRHSGEGDGDDDDDDDSHTEEEHAGGDGDNGEDDGSTPDDDEDEEEETYEEEDDEDDDASLYDDGAGHLLSGRDHLEDALLDMYSPAMATGGGDSGALRHGLAQQTPGSLTYLNDDPVGRPAAAATAMERAQSFAACAYRAILLAVRPLAAHNVVETETPPLPVLHAFEEEAPVEVPALEANQHSGDSNDSSADLAYRLLGEVHQRRVGTTDDSGSPSPQHNLATSRVTTTVAPASALQQRPLLRRPLSSTPLPSPFSAAAGIENTPSDQVMRRGRDSRSPWDTTVRNTTSRGPAAAESASLDATSPATAGTSQRPAPESGNTAGTAEVQTEPTTASEPDTSIDVLTARILALFAAGDANAHITSSADPLLPQASAERASAASEQPTNGAAVAAATPAPAPPAAPEPWEGTLNPQFLIEMPEDVRSEILFDSMNLLRGADEREVRGQRTRLYPGFLNSIPEDAQRHAMEVEARWVRVTGADNNASELYQTLLLVDAETRHDLLLQCDLELLRSYPEVLREATELRAEVERAREEAEQAAQREQERRQHQREQAEQLQHQQQQQQQQQQQANQRQSRLWMLGAWDATWDARGSGATAAATAATVASGIRTSLPALRDMETVEGVMRVMFGSPTPLYEVVNHELFLARRLYRCEMVLQALERPTSSSTSHFVSVYPGRAAEVSGPGLMLSPLRDDDAMREVMMFNHRHGVHRGNNTMMRRAPPRGAPMAAASGTAGAGHYHLPQFPSLQLPPSADVVASDLSVSPLSPPPHTLSGGGGGAFATERSVPGSHAAASPSTSLAALSESMVPVQETVYHPLALPLPDVPEDIVARCIELLRLRATAPLALPCNLLTGISCLDQELQRFMQLLMSDTGTAVRIACQLLDLMAATPTTTAEDALPDSATGFGRPATATTNPRAAARASPSTPGTSSSHSPRPLSTSELAANRQLIKDVTTLFVSLVKQNQSMVSAFFLLPDNTVDTATLKPLDAPLDAAEQRAVQRGLWNRLWRVARQHVHVPSFALALDKLLQQLLRCQRSMSTASEDNELASGADPNARELLTETLIAHPRHPHRLRWTNIRLLTNYEDGGYVCNVCGVNPGFDYCFHCASCQYDLCANCSRERLTLAEMQQRTRRAAALMLQNVPETVTSMMRLLRHPLCRSDVAMNVVHLMSFGLQECGAREGVSLFSADAGSLHSGTASTCVSPIQLLEQELVELAEARVRALKAARDEFRQEVYAILHPRPRSNGHSAGVGVAASAPTRSQSGGATSVSGLSGRHTWQQLSIPEGYVFDTDTVMALLVKLDIKNSEGDAIQLLFEPYVATMRSEPRAFTMLWRASQAYLLDVSTLLEHVAPKEVLPLPSCVSSILQTFCKYHLSESRLLGASSSARTLTDSRSSLAGETEHFLHASTKPSSVSDRAVRELAERPDAAQWMTAAGTRLSEEGLKSAEELQHRRLPRVVRMVLEENRTTLNTLLHWDGNLLKDSFAFLKYEPNLIDFNFKLTDFRRRLGSRRGPNILLRVNRQTCLLDSFKELQKVKSFGGQLHIRFHGEEGADAGGLTREWLQLLSEAIVDERYALFIHSQDSISFQPNPFSSVNPNHLEYFQFAGVVTGLAIAHNVPIDVHFTRAFYRHIIGHRPVFSDLQSFDQELYTNLNWIMENDVTDLGLTFAVNYDRFGSVEEAELEPNGKDTAVTNGNKQQYVRLLCEFYMTKRTEDQLLRFLKGFYSVIPRREIQCFTELELELVISGMPNIDIEDLRTHTVYEGYSSTSPQVRWFWEAVGSMSKEDLANLLQFTTGSSKVPHGGFGHLEGSNGRSLPFTISRWAVTKEDLLPQAHTCFNKIDLPVYTSAAVLKEKLMLAITYGSMGFTMV